MSRYKGALPKLPERGYFKKGDKGPEVAKLQRAVNWANGGREQVVASLKVDEEYGPKTEEAVSFLEEIWGKTIDGEFGKVCRALIRDMDLTGAVRACNIGVAIAKNNKYTYGAGKRAHRSGCPFCGTNTGPRMKKKEKAGEPHVVKDSNGNGHTYANTLCCNTLITTCYAHGAKDPTILKICKSGSCCGMQPSEWTRSPNFKQVGTCKSVGYTKLKMGDVIMSDESKNGWCDHVWMYLGHGRFLVASGNDWSADSIASKPKAKQYYARYQKHKGCYVVRYTK